MEQRHPRVRSPRRTLKLGMAIAAAVVMGSGSIAHAQSADVLGSVEQELPTELGRILPDQIAHSAVGSDTLSSQLDGAGLQQLVVPDHSGPRTYVMNSDGSSGEQLSGDQLINWDIARNTIRAYMGADKNGIANKEQSPYISDITNVINQKTPQIAEACRASVDRGEKPAVVFDADDTTLWTYDMEDAYMHFAFSPVKQQTWFDAHELPATPGMVPVVQQLREAGCTIIGLTGRNKGQKDYTLRNLAHAGYVDKQGQPLFSSELYFTKFRNRAEFDGYLGDNNGGYCDASAATCTTVQYKSGTRRHIQDDLGYRIVGNYGDQWSDLMGGNAENWVKLPNPTYYLPSANLPEWEERDAAAGMQPASGTYTLTPDGSMGARDSVVGDDIPNMDIVKKTIRRYYNAHKAADGMYVADRQDSPYIRELTRLTDQWAEQVAQRCTIASQMGLRPAVTFDADDTTVWTYDMEEYLEFAFNEAKQLDYLKTNYHSLPATPGMPRVVEAARASGCTVIGLTGRSNELKDVTLRNLSEAGYGDGAFVPDRYFTKVSSRREDQPAYVHCAADRCTTVEYKAGTRAHIQNDLGYTIVGNFGDQWSDLYGGHAFAAHKLPNPTYYLP